MKYSSNIQTALDVLKDEVKGDITAALSKMSKDYTMTWVYKKGETLFPTSKPDFSADMKDIYPIKGRKYEIKNIAEGESVVMLELIESYPDPKSGEVYRTPLVIVLEMKNGKIEKGRHYCDPDLSWLHLSEEDVGKAYLGTGTKVVVE
jgi:ketosteroid isomerase-like protein